MNPPTHRAALRQPPSARGHPDVGTVPIGPSTLNPPPCPSRRSANAGGVVKSQSLQSLCYKR